MSTNHRHKSRGTAMMNKKIVTSHNRKEQDEILRSIHNNMSKTIANNRMHRGKTKEGSVRVRWPRPYTKQGRV